MLKKSVILFDFDGVIMDSMDLKLESYLYALSEYQFDKDQVSQIQKEMAGYSRHIVLTEIIKRLNNKTVTPLELKQYSAKFEQYDVAQIHRMQFIDGSKEYLENKPKHFYTAVVTGTPQFAIERVIKAHNLNKTFSSIHGSPESKSEIINRLIKENHFSKKEVVFIGDGLVDQKAAIESDIDFIGFNANGSSFNEQTCQYKISNLMELKSVILHE